MRVFYIFAIICIAGSIYAAHIPNNNGYEVKEDDWIFSSRSVACTSETNFNIVTFQRQVGDIPYPPPPGYEIPKGFYCYMSCMMAKDLKEDEQGHKKTLEVAFRNVIDNADDILKNTNYTRQDVEIVTNKCKDRGLNDCDYLRCIKFFEPPMFTLYKSY